ncbi:MAG: hypothetical protein FGM33_04090 [Candidatus Kapabacteria bacterium]|nr:hypothetical protein [Candidatus Kapabacteria bacterium]
MPVEIRELHIKVNVTQSAAATPTSTAAAQPGGGSAAGAPSSDIVTQAVEQVLEILRQEKER